MEHPSATPRSRPGASPAPATLARLERPAPLSEQAYETIRALLLSPGGPEIGARLVERELADQLSMSRTPVRDALRRLSLAGVVEPAGPGGYVVRKPTIREVREHYDLRLLLEPFAARLAAEAGADLRVDPDESGPEGNTRFHDAVAEASGNGVLRQVIGALNERLAIMRIYARAEGPPGRDLRAGHPAVAGAISRRDPDAAGDAMREHLALARDLLVRELSQRGRS